MNRPRSDKPVSSPLPDVPAWAQALSPLTRSQSSIRILASAIQQLVKAYDEAETEEINGHRFYGYTRLDIRFADGVPQQQLAASKIATYRVEGPP